MELSWRERAAETLRSTGGGSARTITDACKAELLTTKMEYWAMRIPYSLIVSLIDIHQVY
jgi:hypothetical protein